MGRAATPYPEGRRAAGQVTPRENAVADLAAQEASHLVPRHLADCCCQVHHHLRRLLGAEHDDGVEGGDRLSGEVLGSPGDEAVPALSWFEDLQRRCRPFDGGVGFVEHDPMRETGSLAMRLDAGEQSSHVRLARTGAAGDEHVGLGGSEHGGPPFSGVADPERATLRVDLPTAVQDVAWDERADA